MAGVLHIAITITDGEANNATLTKRATKILIANGVASFAIGVEPYVEISELEAIATDPNCNYLTILEGLNEILDVTAQIQKRICEDELQVKLRTSRNSLYHFHKY